MAGRGLFTGRKYICEKGMTLDESIAAEAAKHYNVHGIWPTMALIREDTAAETLGGIPVRGGAKTISYVNEFVLVVNEEERYAEPSENSGLSDDSRPESPEWAGR